MIVEAFGNIVERSVDFFLDLGFSRKSCVLYFTLLLFWLCGAADFFCILFFVIHLVYLGKRINSLPLVPSLLPQQSLIQ